MDDARDTGRGGGRLASPVVRSVLSAFVALVFYGAWAAWANRMHDLPMMLTASATQALYSAVVTLLMTSMVEALYRGEATRALRLSRAIGLTVVVLVVSSVAVHLLVGTMEILMTVLPSWIFGSIYAVAYALGLARAEARPKPDPSGAAA